MTIVELSENDLALFSAYKKHKEMFDAILEAELYTVKRGEATLFFNHEGQLMHIEIKRTAYRKK